MRDLTTIELQSVSGGVMAPAPIRVPTRLFGIRLTSAQQRELAKILSLLLPAPRR